MFLTPLKSFNGKRSISGDYFVDLILQNQKFVNDPNTGILKLGKSVIYEQNLKLFLAGVNQRKAVLTSMGEILFIKPDGEVLFKKFNHTPLKKNQPNNLNSKQFIIQNIQQNVKYVIFDQFQGRYFIILSYLGETSETNPKTIIEVETYMIQTGTQAFADFFSNNESIANNAVIEVCKNITRLPSGYVAVNSYNLCSCFNRENDYDGGIEDGVDRDQFCMLGFLQDKRAEYKEKLNLPFYQPVIPYCPCVNNKCQLARGINPTANVIDQNQCQGSLSLTVCNVNIDVDNFTANNFNIGQNCGGGGGNGNCPVVNGQLCTGRGLCINNECVCENFIGNECQFAKINCSNNGYQSSQTGECVCVNGFTGDRCQVPPPNACDGVVCQNGGNCQDGFCNCTGGFTGSSCEVPPQDPCDGVVCQNGGNCQNGSCNCTGGFTGSTCEVPPQDPCDGVVCQNGGQCLFGECVCTGGFTGSTCEVPPDDCYGVNCPTGQICKEGVCVESDVSNDGLPLGTIIVIVFGSIILFAAAAIAIYIYFKR